MNVLIVGNSLLTLAAVSSLLDKHPAINLSLIIGTSDVNTVGYWDTSTVTRVKTFKTHSLNIAVIRELIRVQKIDIGFVVGWPELIKDDLLNQIKWVGFHPTKLPKGRGRAPIPNSILAGEMETSISFFELTKSPDDGRIYLQVTEERDPEDQATRVYAQVRRMIEENFGNLVRMIKDGIEPYEQVGTPTYYPKRTPEMSRIDFKTLYSSEVIRFINALTDPYPNANSFLEMQGSFDVCRVDYFRAYMSILESGQMPGTVIKKEVYNENSLMLSVVCADSKVVNVFCRLSKMSERNHDHAITFKAILSSMNMVAVS